MSIRVNVDDAKYTVIQDRDGKLTVLRNGVAWRDETGDKLILAMAHEIQELRDRVETLREEAAEKEAGEDR